MVGFGLGNFLIGKVIDRFGLKIPIIFATIILVSSYLAAIISTEFWHLLILQIFMGTAAATFFGPAMADIGNFFEKRRGLAVAIIASANYVAGAFWPLLISSFLELNNWKEVYFIIAIICATIMFPISYFSDTPQLYNQKPVNFGKGLDVLKVLRGWSPALAPRLSHPH